MSNFRFCTYLKNFWACDICAKKEGSPEFKTETDIRMHLKNNHFKTSHNLLNFDEKINFIVNEISKYDNWIKTSTVFNMEEVSEKILHFIKNEEQLDSLDDISFERLIKQIKSFYIQRGEVESLLDWNYAIEIYSDPSTGRKYTTIVDTIEDYSDEDQDFLDEDMEDEDDWHLECNDIPWNTEKYTKNNDNHENENNFENENAFNKDESLTDRIDLQDMNIQYSCEICGLMYKAKDELKMHSSLVHEKINLNMNNKQNVNNHFSEQIDKSTYESNFNEKNFCDVILACDDSKFEDSQSEDLDKEYDTKIIDKYANKSYGECNSEDDVSIIDNSHVNKLEKESISQDFRENTEDYEDVDNCDTQSYLKDSNRGGNTFSNLQYCDVCEISFNSEFCRKDHVNYSTMEKVDNHSKNQTYFQCNECNFQTNKVVNFKNHCTKDHYIACFVCIKCGLFNDKNYTCICYRHIGDISNFDEDYYDKMIEPAIISFLKENCVQLKDQIGSSTELDEDIEYDDILIPECDLELRFETFSKSKNLQEELKVFNYLEDPLTVKQKTNIIIANNLVDENCGIYFSCDYCQKQFINKFKEVKLIRIQKERKCDACDYKLAQNGSILKQLKILWKCRSENNNGIKSDNLFKDDENYFEDTAKNCQGIKEAMIWIKCIIIENSKQSKDKIRKLDERMKDWKRRKRKLENKLVEIC